MDDFDVKKLYDLEKYTEPESAIVQDMDKANSRKDFLDAISMIESSGGKNFDHRVLESGMHEGQAAAGRYGLMPSTVKEVINRKIQADRGHDLKPMLDQQPDEIKKTIESNPLIETRIAEGLADRVLDRNDMDEEKAAYSWMYGHNLTPDQIDKRDYKSDDYVKKFNKYKKTTKTFNDKK